jgi:hypothetical protein
LYVVERVRMICKLLLAAVRGSCSARSYALRRLAEAGEKAGRAFWANRDGEALYVPEHEDHSRVRLRVHAACSWRAGETAISSIRAR